MNQNLTELVIISDRSGSMQASYQEAENAINKLITDQQGEEGECRLTFVEFDGVYDVIADNQDVKSFDGYKLVPRGMTALYDAIGRGISTVGERLSKTEEKDRPALVTVIISTDGDENASKEYTLYEVAKMIKTQREKFSWKFVFIGVEIDAEAIAVNLNIDVNAAVNIQRKNSQAAYGTTSDKLRAARSMSRRGASAQSIQTMSYTEQEKTELGSE